MEPVKKKQELNILWKTQLCKNFTEVGTCIMGTECHFAHGNHELRSKEEELPLEMKYKMMKIPYNNFKTRVCKYYKNNEACLFGKNCTFAHGDHELRKPYR